MKTIKTSDLTGVALDWAAAKVEGVEFTDEARPYAHELMHFNYSTDWSQGGPIIEREGIAVDCVRESGVVVGWIAGRVYPDLQFDGVAYCEQSGDTPLIAAMRCYVASKLGDEVSIPEGLE